MAHGVATAYRLRLATVVDQPWLQALRRDVYYDLMVRTFGVWDEKRLVRHAAECWARGPILLVEVDGQAAGMIQLFESAEAIDVSELQLRPDHQRLGLGSLLLRDVQARAHSTGRSVRLSVAHRNDGALRLYRRLGFEEFERDPTHIRMLSRPGW